MLLSEKITQIRLLLAEDETEMVITQLNNLVESLNWDNLKNNLDIIAAQYQRYEKDKTLQLDSNENLNITRNKLNNSLSEFMDELLEFEANKDNPPEPNKLVEEETNPSDDLPPRQQLYHRNSYVPLGVGLLFILLIFASVLFIPNPSDHQFWVFQLMVALGAGGVASIIPGFLELRYTRFVQAGGGLAAFFLVYYYAPELSSSVPIQQEETFSFSINLKPVAGFSNNDYPKLDKFDLYLHLHDTILERSGNGEEVIKFDEIGERNRYGDTKIILKSEFWNLEETTIKLKGNEGELFVKPNDVLKSINGKVKGENIENTKIELSEINKSTLVNSNGNFDFILNIDERKLTHKLIISGEGITSQEIEISYPNLTDLDIELKAGEVATITRPIIPKNTLPTGANNTDNGPSPPTTPTPQISEPEVENEPVVTPPPPPPPHEFCSINSMTLVKGNGQSIPDFFMDKKPVTKKQFLNFINATKGGKDIGRYFEKLRRYNIREYEDEDFDIDENDNISIIDSNSENDPITRVTFYGASEYLKWRDKKEVSNCKCKIQLASKALVEHIIGTNVSSLNTEWLTASANSSTSMWLRNGSIKNRNAKATHSELCFRGFLICPN